MPGDKFLRCVAKLTLTAAVSVALQAQTGIITTYAGGGTGGDGVTATASNIGFPSQLALDTNGNLLIATGASVKRVDASTGIITTIAGGGSGGDGGPATAAVVAACGIAVDSSNNLFISEDCVVASQGGGTGGGSNGTGGTARIRRVDSITGIITTIAGAPAGNSSGFSSHNNKAFCKCSRFAA